MRSPPTTSQDSGPGPVADSRRVALVGEVLFDCFPDAERLGGAPFNVAWHLTGLGQTARLVSRIGDDPLGTRIRTAMAAHGMDDTGLQGDPQRPTGRVSITLDGHGGHAFTILPDQAYDHLDRDLMQTALTPPPELIYFGTLMLRTTPHRMAILDAVAACPGIRLLDVNLRDGCWTPDSVTAALERATVVKLNDDELAVLAALHGWEGSETDRARALMAAHHLDGACVTRGPRGALWMDRNGPRTVAAPALESHEIIDTVGAGDGFAALLAMGLLQRWDMETTLTRAARFAAGICRLRGACPEDPDHYQRTMATWEPPP